jgi:hypothetical protein
MKLGEAFPSKWLKAADLHGRKIGVTIDSVEMSNIGDEDKLIVYFKDKSKGLILNVTNANMIAEIAGTDETDNWRGVQIALYSTKVDFSGRRVDAVRVDYPAGGNGAVSPSQRPAAAPPVQQPAPLDDSDVPF